MLRKFILLTCCGLILTSCAYPLRDSWTLSRGEWFVLWQRSVIQLRNAERIECAMVSRSHSEYYCLHKELSSPPKTRIDPKDIESITMHGVDFRLLLR